MVNRNEAFAMNEADLTRQAQRLRAEAFAGWVRGLRQRIGARTRA